MKLFDSVRGTDLDDPEFAELVAAKSGELRARHVLPASRRGSGN